MRALKQTTQLSDQDRAVLRQLELRPIRLWPRRTLAEAAGVSDRSLRKSLERLRRSGVAVISSSRHGGGYKLAQNAEEIERYAAEQMSRVRVIVDEVSALRELARLMHDRGLEPMPQALL